MVRIVNFQPAFMDFHVVDRKTSVNHFLYEIGESETGDILGLLKFPRKILHHSAAH